MCGGSHEEDCGDHGGEAHGALQSRRGLCPMWVISRDLRELDALDHDVFARTVARVGFEV